MTQFQNIAFLFPGQGAQYPGMGKDFAENFPVAKWTFEEADDVLGRKLSSIIFEGPDASLTQTHNSQVGIFITSVAILRVLNELFPALQPQVCSGLSLGEYTALFASKRLSFADCLRLVQTRANLMSEACEQTKGTMAVVLGLDSDAVESLVKEVNLPNDLWVANLNCPGQVVISGTLRGIEEGSKAAKAKGARRIIPLSVHGAFHSGLMKQAEGELTESILHVLIQDSSIDLVMNVVGDYVTDIQQIRQCLIKQVTGVVRWEQGVRRMAERNRDLFIEIGCGEVLAGFNKRIGVVAPTMNVEKIEDLSKLEQFVSHIS